jgi:hypothetical protein
MLGLNANEGVFSYLYRLCKPFFVPLLEAENIAQDERFKLRVSAQLEFSMDGYQS